MSREKLLRLAGLLACLLFAAFATTQGTKLCRENFGDWCKKLYKDCHGVPGGATYGSCMRCTDQTQRNDRCDGDPGPCDFAWDLTGCGKIQTSDCYNDGVCVNWVEGADCMRSDCRYTDPPD